MVVALYHHAGYPGKQLHCISVMKLIAACDKLFSHLSNNELFQQRSSVKQERD